MKLSITYKDDLRQEEFDVYYINFDSDQNIDYCLSTDTADSEIRSVETKRLIAFAVEL